MYPVNNRLHTLAFEENVKTRIRVYFISDSVDCTDDDDVQTNGTLLVGAAGDTDSNGRISFDQGVTFNEYFNPDKNIQIGAAVSSNVTMTLLNYDGALDGFSYGRCKIYLDAYDDENSVWLPCPMGVYIIDIPVKRKTKLVNVIGYDQMQKFDGICDAWWSSLNWSGGITLSQLLTSLATQIGVSVSSNTASAIVNGTVSFTEEPFQCNEVTYREVLEYIAEATGTVARFDRNGALDLRWFAAAQISGNTVTVNTDTVGNHCLAISVAEYSVAAVDLLKVKLYTDDIGITVGTGTNQYTIVNNLFLDGANSSAIIAKATPIYNRLHGLDAYSPVSARIITDWSIEAGDIINIVNDSTTYSVPIFQQSMAWRGGYVVSDFLSDGDNVRPVLDYDERTYYRLNSEMSKKVGDNEIISKINQSPEQITIQANKINLIGTVTANDGFVVNQDGTVEMNGATVNGTISVGGTNDINGVLNVYDADGNLCGRINNNGLTVFQYELGRLNSLLLSGGYMKMKTGDTTAAFLNRTTQGSGVFHLCDSQGRERVAMRGSTANVLAIDPNGLVRAEIASDGTLALTDSSNVRRFYMGLGGLFTVKDESGNVRYKLDSSNGSVVSKDAGEVTRCKLNNTGLTVYDPNGNAIGSLLEVSGKSALTVDNATINGVLDVTSRRCNAALSTIGWYRVLEYSAESSSDATGVRGVVIKLNAQVWASPAENHSITVRCGGGGVSFVDESSKAGATLNIDKIRYTYDSSTYKVYVDIHYATTSSHDVGVDFTVSTSYPDAQSKFVSAGLSNVADSPSGETVLSEYAFHANGAGDVTVGGVLDVTQRRCSASLSQAGWYRVLKCYGGIPDGGIIKLMIGRDQNGECHEVDLLVPYGYRFLNEVSVSNASFGITKARITRDGNYARLDVYYALNTSSLLRVDFIVAGTLNQNNVTAENLQWVEESPAYETITRQHTFAANTAGTASLIAITSRGAITSGEAVYVGRMIHLNFVFTASATATNSPQIASAPNALYDTALSAIDITSGMSTAISESIPCGIGTTGKIFLQSITTGHIYAITGDYLV